MTIRISDVARAGSDDNLRNKVSRRRRSDQGNASETASDHTAEVYLTEDEGDPACPPGGGGNTR